MTLPVILNRYIGVYSNEYGVFLAGTLLAIVPPAILFFALEKEFISGLTSGAVKANVTGRASEQEDGKAGRVLVVCVRSADASSASPARQRATGPNKQTFPPSC
jgi:hypothetical protein